MCNLHALLLRTGPWNPKKMGHITLSSRHSQTVTMLSHKDFNVILFVLEQKQH